MLLRGLNCVVTGGAGAIGSHLTSALLNGGAKVTVVDDLSSGHLENVPTNARIVTRSILDPSALAAVFKAPVDVVFHLAALFANQNSIEHPEEDLSTNALGTLRVLEAARACGARVVYASSSCVKDTLTPYAVSKFAGEQYVRCYAQQHGLPTAVVRYFNSYGPHDYPGQYRSVVPNFLWKAMKGEALTVYGDGSDTRDYTYVGDIVEGTIRAGTLDGALGGVFDLGAGGQVSSLELATLVLSVVCNPDASLELRPKRSWDRVASRRADLSEAEGILGYAPAMAIREGLQRTYEWLRHV